MVHLTRAHLSSFSSPLKGCLVEKKLIITIEVLVLGILTAGLVCFAHQRGLNSLSQLSIGVVSGVSIIIVSVSTHIAFLKKKTTSFESNRLEKTEPAIHVNEQIAPIESQGAEDLTSVHGSIFIKSAYAFLLDQNLPQLYSKFSKIKRIDGVDWMLFPNEMLIDCHIFNSSSKQAPESLYLPFCLFTRDNDYTQWKKEGDLVEFFLETVRYSLVIQKPCESLEDFRMQMNYCLFNTPCQQYPFTIAQEKLPPKLENPFLWQIKKNKKQLEDVTKQNFYTLFSNCGIDLPKIDSFEVPYYKTEVKNGVASFLCQLPGVGIENIHYYFTDTAFALYAKREFWPKEYLLVLLGKSRSFVNPEFMQKAKKNTEDGILQIFSPLPN